MQGGRQAAPGTLPPVHHRRGFCLLGRRCLAQTNTLHCEGPVVASGCAPVQSVEESQRGLDDKPAARSARMRLSKQPHGSAAPKPRPHTLHTRSTRDSALPL